MAKKLKNFRLDESTIQTLDKLVDFYFKEANLFNGKKVTATDIIELLIHKEKEILKKQGYNFK